MIAPFVDLSQLEALGAAVVLADVRWYLEGRSGAAEYARGHLPGAVFVDLDRCLAAVPSVEEGRHPLPAPEAFADAMANLGIGDRSIVVAYDDAGGVVAARLAWMLRALGHEAAVLDGGIAAYPGALELGPRRPPPRAEFTAAPWPPDLLANIDDVLDAGNVVIDARDRERFLGEAEPVDARPGHVPGARNVPCRGNVDVSGRLLPPETLAARFRAVGVAGHAPVVSYCGSGVTACHNLLALEQCGLARGRLYPGSWSQYAARRDLPAEVGEPERR